MKTSEELLNGFDYLSDPMTKGKNNDRFTSLSAFVAAISANMELDFNFNGTRWYLGPFENGRYLLSRNDGGWAHVFESVDQILDFKIDGLTIRNNWQEIEINEL